MEAGKTQKRANSFFPQAKDGFGCELGINRTAKFRRQEVEEDKPDPRFKGTSRIGLTSVSQEWAERSGRGVPSLLLLLSQLALGGGAALL